MEGGGGGYGEGRRVDWVRQKHSDGDAAPPWARLHAAGVFLD